MKSYFVSQDLFGVFPMQKMKNRIFGTYDIVNLILLNLNYLVNFIIRIIEQKNLRN